MHKSGHIFDIKTAKWIFYIRTVSSTSVMCVILCVCLCTLRIVPFVCILDLFKSFLYGWILVKFFTKLDVQA